MRNKCMIVAEMSANHNGSLETAIETVRAAKRAGADAIKLQTYTADTLTLDCDNEEFMAPGIWHGQTLYQLYSQAYTPWEWHKEIFSIAKEIGLLCFSTPFDKTAVDFLEKLDNPIYKIASFEITDIPLIEYAARLKKPMVISTGIATIEDIEGAIKACHRVGNSDITLLKCTSAYPAPINEANLVTIKDMAKRFNVRTGLSDHTIGSISPIIAISQGASLIEKHFILDHSIGGPDASFSMDEKEFTMMARDIRNAEQALGKVSYELTQKQAESKKLCRSLYVSSPMKIGDKLTEHNLRSVRPGLGLHPKYLPIILGKKVNKDLDFGTPFSLDYILEEV